MNRRSLIGLAASLALAAGGSSALAQVGTAVSYQGRLKDSGALVNSATDMQFSLWDAASGGNQVGSTVEQLAVAVSQGLFTTDIDFGVNPYTSDQALWLQIDVRNPAGSGSYVPMGARQKLSAAPFSLATRGISVDGTGKVGIGTTPDKRLDVLAGSLADGIRLRGTGGDSPAISLTNGTAERFSLALALGVGHFSSDALVNDIVLRAVNGGRLLIQNGGNAAAIAIDTNNRVGIGTTIPQSGLSVVGALGQNAANINLGVEAAANGVQSAALTLSGSGIFNAGIGYTPNLTTGNSRLDFGFGFDGNPTSQAANIKTSMLANGNVGFGVTSPGHRIDVADGSTIGSSTVVGGVPGVPANNGTKVQFGYEYSSGCGPNTFDGMKIIVGTGSNCGSTTDIAFFTEECNVSCPREVVRINGDGNLGIGTAAPTQRLHVIGNILATGNITPSCAKLKENVVPMSDALDRIDGLEAVRFDWIADEAETRGFTHDLGFIAEDVAKSFPEIVFRDENGEIIGLDYSRMSAVAVGAIKQLKGENDQLKARLEKIEALLAAQAENAAK